MSIFESDFLNIIEVDFIYLFYRDHYSDIKELFFILLNDQKQHLHQNRDKFVTTLIIFQM